jgi:hypothetical protein
VALPANSSAGVELQACNAATSRQTEAPATRRLARVAAIAIVVTARAIERVGIIMSFIAQRGREASENRLGSI